MLVGGASLLGQTLRERNETRTDIYTIMIDAVGIAHPTKFTTVPFLSLASLISMVKSYHIQVVFIQLNAR